MNMRYAKRSEDTEQINVVSWACWNVNRYPELKWLFHVPNGGSRNRAEAVKFKQMGVKAGVSDLQLPYPKGSYCGLFVEMKFGNNRQQDTQKEFLEDMAAAPDKRCGEGIVKILKAAVEEIYTGGLAKVTLNLRGGVKASISQNSKGEINVERTETKKQKLTE